MFPSRVRDYRPGMLDELLASGDVVWAGARREGDEGDGHGRAPRPRSSREREAAGLVAFYPTDSPFAPVRPDLADAPSDGPKPEGSAAPSVEAAVVEALGFGGGLFFRQIVDAVRRRLAPEFVDEAVVASTMRELMWDGRATNDTYAPVRASLEGAGAAAGKPRSASTCEQPPVRHAHRRFSDDAGHSVRAGRGGRGSDGAVVAHHAVAGERHGARHRAGGIDPRSLRRAVSRRGAAVGRARWAGRVASRAAADGGRGGCAARRVRAGPRPRAVRRARDHRRAAHLRGGRRRGRSTRARRARCRRSRVPVRCRPALAAGRARRCRGRGGA